MELSKKVLVTLMIIPVVIVIIAIACWQNWGGIGTALAGFGGPVGKGLTELAQKPFTFGLTGAAQTFLLYGVGAALVFGFAYWVWHWDIGYKLTGAAKTSSPSSGYDNDMAREPTEPERSTITK